MGFREIPQTIHWFCLRSNMIRACTVTTWIMHIVACVTLVMKSVTYNYAFVVHPWASKSD